LRYRVEIDNANTIRIWDEVQPTSTGAPFLLQDVHPDGRPWADRAEAESWANSFVASLPE